MSNANPLRCAATGVASKLAEHIASDTFVVTSELNPPKGIDLTSLLSRASELAGRVDGFNLTDSHTARMSMSPLAAAHLIMDHGHEPIVQLTTRDRNRIALQSDLLGAAALGIPNVVLMGGDDPGAGDHPGAKPVFDFDTEVLIRAAHQLTTGTDFGGKTLVGTPKLFIGAVVNPGAANLDREIQRMEEKVNAGASFFQTQAIYDSPAFEAFIRRVEHLKVAILAGIIPNQVGNDGALHEPKCPWGGCSRLDHPAHRGHKRRRIWEQCDQRSHPPPGQGVHSGRAHHGHGLGATYPRHSGPGRGMNGPSARSPAEFLGWAVTCHQDPHDPPDPYAS